jgi:glycosyltransferase involved in cell wall biosynthesis
MAKVRIAAVMEATTVTGPAKNLIRFCCLAREHPSAPELSVVTFLRTSSSGPESNAFTEAARAIGLKVHVIPERSPVDALVCGRFGRVLRELSPDIVQTHGSKSHFFARMARPAAAKWLAYHHGYTDEDRKMRFYNRVGCWSMRAADRVVTVCKPFARELEASGIERGRIRVLPNSIDPRTERAAAQTDLPAEHRIPPGVPCILAVGRLSPEKGHRDLIEALAILRGRRPDLDFRALIVGDGTERISLERQIADAGLSGSVILAGHRSNPLPYYRAANVFVLPSHSEGSPNVLLEAMALGIPIAACAVGGVPESVTHERSALLVEPGSPVALADSIERLLTDTSLAQRMAKAAIEAAESLHAPAIYCSSLLSIYSELL